ncbi:Protein UXT [Smittium mucronatum]|uniref:Protein UXT n=2 Tax=Smittium mucronatum TaxID=133383 RepID=A0A1R0GS41_9FUNG|nr:Protein UXT [Smittium mucronatum]
MDAIQDPETKISFEKYDSFIQGILYPKLKETAELRDSVYDKISEYLKLKSLIETIEDHSLDTLKLSVDLGSNFYVQGKADSTEFIYVNVGFGFYLKMTKPEAKKFIESKQEHLEKLADSYTVEINLIRAKIKVIQEAMSSVLGF